MGYMLSTFRDFYRTLQFRRSCSQSHNSEKVSQASRCSRDFIVLSEEREFIPSKYDTQYQNLTTNCISDECKDCLLEYLTTCLQK